MVRISRAIYFNASTSKPNCPLPPIASPESFNKTVFHLYFIGMHYFPFNYTVKPLPLDKKAILCYNCSINFNLFKRFESSFVSVEWLIVLLLTMRHSLTKKGLRRFFLHYSSSALFQCRTKAYIRPHHMCAQATFQRVCAPKA